MTTQLNGEEPLGIRVSQIAARLGCHKDHVYGLIRDGYLKEFPGPGVKLVTVESWRRYLESAGIGDAAAS